MLSKRTKERIRRNKERRMALMLLDRFLKEVNAGKLPPPKRHLINGQNWMVETTISGSITISVEEALPRIVWESRSTNPNNCSTCRYHPDPDATGHCYMFRDVPRDVCMQHSGREKPISFLSAGLSFNQP